MTRAEIEHGFHNQTRARYLGCGEYGLPYVFKADRLPSETEWIGFNFVKGCQEPEKNSVHFFLSDYQFERVWKRPDQYSKRLKQFQAVIAPDFSPYRDLSKALQVYNIFRRQWLARYWQDMGVNVIPSVSWIYEDSYDWCFDGLPKDSILAVGTKSRLKTEKHKNIFMCGFWEMLERLSPKMLLFFGDIPVECAPCGVPMIHCDTHTDYLKRGENRARNGKYLNR